MNILKSMFYLTFPSGSFQKFLHGSDDEGSDKDEELLRRRTKTQVEKVLRLKCSHTKALDLKFQLCFINV